MSPSNLGYSSTWWTCYLTFEESFFKKHMSQESCPEWKRKKQNQYQWMKVIIEGDQGANTRTEGHVSCHNHTVHKTGVVSASWGEWSQVHFNACFISPLILIKRILSRLLGINTDWFWHHGCPRGPGLLFQGSCICFWLLTLPFWCVGNIRHRAIPTCLR